MRRFILAGSAVSFLAAGAFAAPAAGDDAPAAKTAVDLKAEFDAVKAEYDKANQEFMTAYRAAKDDEGRTAALAKRPNPDDYAPRFAEIASKDAKSDVAANCHAWIALNARDAEMKAAGLDELMANHLASPGGVAVCKDLVYSGGLLYSEAANRDEFLRAVLEKSSDHVARGCACYTLAFGLARRGKTAEAEPLFERVVKEFADVKFVMGSIAEKAKSDLFELRNLSVGKPAPEIVGEDENGKALKLSDFRGKVVMLDFWGFW